MVPNPTPLYHITDIENLRGIIGRGGLGCPNELRRLGIGYTSIAYRNIQEVRVGRRVPCGPEGVIHDYVPFYFAPRPPMLYAIHTGSVDQYEKGQGAIVYLVTTVQSVVEAGRQFVFSDGHAIMELSNFYDDVNRLDQVDWNVMRSPYWFDSDEHPDRKRRRQAEFLVYRSCPWRLITEVAVIDEPARAVVADQLRDAGHKPRVMVRRQWYY